MPPKAGGPIPTAGSGEEWVLGGASFASLARGSSSAEVASVGLS